jgi:hypothetical protein
LRKGGRGTECGDVIWITSKSRDILFNPEKGIALIDDTPIPWSKTIFIVFCFFFKVVGGEESEPA